MAHHGALFNQLGPPSHRPPPVALPLPHIINAPFALYGIAYDFFLHDIEDNLSRGWAEWHDAYTVA